MGPISAFALTVDTSGSGSANSSSSNTSGSVTGSTNVDVGVSGSAGADASGHSTDSTGNTSGTGSASSNGSVSGNGSGSLNLEANQSGIVIRQAGQVASEGDLRVFGDNAAKMDANVRSVDTDGSNDVRVSYAHPGRFLGFIPVTVTSQTDVSVDEQGSMSIKTHMPWWNFLVTRTHQIQNDVDTYLSASLSGSAALTADASATERARIAEAIIRAHSSLEAGASANANGSVQQY